ncbi:winged helix-turn-helix domain-containing protein [Marinomonas sp.]
MMSLSLEQAQKIVLLSQGLLTKAAAGSAYQQTLAALERLGYVQIDTISVVQRAHHHVLWSRNPRYQPEHLDRLIKERKAFEYWSHAAAYLPMQDYRYSLPRKQALKSGVQSHWYKRDAKLMDYVLDRIRAEGPLMAKDFESSVAKRTGWESKPTKQALETLFMQGDLMISERQSFHKVYDLTERVLPAGIDTSLPSPEDHAEHLVLSYLSAQGLGQLQEMAYLLKGVKPQVEAALNRLMEKGVIQQVSVQGNVFYTTQKSLDLLDQRMKRNKVCILSPFDNLVIQRSRLKTLFQYDYTIECYVPAIKRQFGYFCLPILWQGQLVGRLDCKAHRKNNTLEINQLFIEKKLSKEDAFRAEFAEQLQAFADFNQVPPPEHFSIQYVQV